MNIITTPEQLAAACADLLDTESGGAAVYLEWREAVLEVKQGDDCAYYGPKGELLAREEVGLVEDGTPREPIAVPGVYYAGEEAEPLSAEEVARLLAAHHEADPRKQYHAEFAWLDDPAWGPWIDRLSELNRWDETGAPSRTLICRYTPADMQPARQPAPVHVVAVPDRMDGIYVFASEADADEFAAASEGDQGVYPVIAGDVAAAVIEQERSA